MPQWWPHEIPALTLPLKHSCCEPKSPSKPISHHTPCTFYLGQAGQLLGLRAHTPQASLVPSCALHTVLFRMSQPRGHLPIEAPPEALLPLSPKIHKWPFLLWALFFPTELSLTLPYFRVTAAYLITSESRDGDFIISGFLLPAIVLDKQ